ncbi:hypothetical protein [Thermoleptolyngbya sp. M55_K2018_002]|uniref:hypothetical protein n=1 Tax=Thermoleptolyngbya sp. M55_K2018_002 TaxID=2747808 RepID=UPI001A04E2C7|nr:hypothetical protein [Thermoleptolyngbya sp. M55_K2018_002]HIK39787.1 hypothetical protein [Thermoleptolyngbya sp. M55_K2018_002]
MPKEPDPWEQQLGEPNLWFDRFHAYLLMGSGRSLLGAYNQEREKARKGATKTIPSAWNDAATRWDWQHRAWAFDRQIRLRDHQRWATRREEFRERQWRLAEKLLERAEEMLERSLSSTDKDGNIIERWNFRDAATFVSEGTKLARQAAEIFDSDLNAALTLVERYHDDLPKAIAEYQKTRSVLGEIPAAGTPEHYLAIEDYESYNKATEGLPFPLEAEE